jgi:hypothetical protein
MTKTQQFRFSLRTLFIGCTIAAVLVAIVVSQYRAYDRWQRSICKVGGRLGFQSFNASFNWIALRTFHDHQDRPVAGILQVYDAYSPNVPALMQDYRYANRGGILSIDGERVDPAGGPFLFVNGPYGHTVRLATTERELAALFDSNQRTIRPTFDFWQQCVEPRIYKLSGSSVGGKRDGLWVYRLTDNRLYMEANYRQGERHGDWTTYYPDGKVQTRQQFDSDKPSGHWEYFDEEGALLGVLDWKDGHIQRKGNERFIQGGSGSSTYVARDGVTTGHFISDREGGKFLLEGKPMSRPRLDPSLLAPQE